MSEDVSLDSGGLRAPRKVYSQDLGLSRRMLWVFDKVDAGMGNQPNEKIIVILAAWKNL